MKYVIPTKSRSTPAVLAGKTMLALGAVAALGYFATLITLWKKQDNLIFVKAHEQASEVSGMANVERIEMSTPDGAVLRGWLRRPKVLAGATAKDSPLLVYYGGNAEDVSSFIAHNRLPEHWMVLAMHYRGFGSSEGEPSAKALTDDALIVFDKALSLPRVNLRQVIVMGRSLGTGIATWVSSSRPVATTVLVSPYDSFRKVAADNYPWVPVQWLMRQDFSAAKWALNTNSRLIAVIGADDKIVLPERSRSLFNVWPTAHKELVEIPSAGHTLYGLETFWDRLHVALADVAPARALGRLAAIDRRHPDAKNPAMQIKAGL